MRIEKVSYRMLRVVADYENDSVEMTAVLDTDDTPTEVIKALKKACSRALGGGTRDQDTPF